MKNNLELFLVETPTLNYNSEEVQDFIAEFRSIEDTTLKAIQVYNKVRDSFIYDPYHLDLNPEQLKASVICTHKRAWCVEKAILLAACLRGLSIPSRLGFGIVKNHVGVEKLMHYLRKEEIVFHGYTSVYLKNNWIKCTPAFDKRICKLNGVMPLEWDGENDSLFQEYRLDEQKFMEYLHFYGEFDDVPFALMHEEMKKHYPHLFDPNIIWEDKSFSFKFSQELI